MSRTWPLAVVKVVTVAAFLVLLSSTYYLRSEVLTLNKIGFSSDNVRAEYEIERLEREFPTTLAAHEVAVKNYELQLEHYNEMIELYRTNYEEYAKRLEQEYRPPQIPTRPQPPRPPEYQRKLAEINAQFRAQKYRYFERTSVLNWVAMAAALALVGGLLSLILFDAAGPRLIYFGALVLSFVFMIGPAFHSILSAIVGFLHAPGIY